MTNWPSKVWLQIKIVWPSPTRQPWRGVLPTLCTSLGDGILCTLLPNHNIHRENGVSQWCTTYALKPKSVSEMHFSRIWRSKFTDLANSKKTKSCRQKCLDKSLTMARRFLWIRSVCPSVQKFSWNWASSLKILSQMLKFSQKCF